MTYGLERVLDPVARALATLRRFVADLPLATIAKIEEVIHELTDPTVPVWRRALLATALIELLSPVKIARPLRFALRYLVVRLALEAGGAVRADVVVGSSMSHQENT